MVVSKQELIDLVEQINSKFDQIFKRLDDLETPKPKKKQETK